MTALVRKRFVRLILLPAAAAAAFLCALSSQDHHPRHVAGQNTADPTSTARSASGEISRSLVRRPALPTSQRFLAATLSPAAGFSSPAVSQSRILDADKLTYQAPALPAVPEVTPRPVVKPHSMAAVSAPKPARLVPQASRPSQVAAVEPLVPAGTKSSPALRGAVVRALPAGPAIDATVAGLNWYALAACESSHEASVVDATGTYYGLYQFNTRTWHDVGGAGNANTASASEQTYRAQLLYAARGGEPWPVCGHHLYDH